MMGAWDGALESGDGLIQVRNFLVQLKFSYYYKIYSFFCI